MNGTPPRNTISTSSVVLRVKETFLLWHKILPHIPKTARFTTGARIETHFLNLLEYIYQAYYTSKENKSELLTKSILENDIIIFLIQTTWESKILSSKHYNEISNKLYEIGKMLGGWKKGVEQKQKP